MFGCCNSFFSSSCRCNSCGGNSSCGCGGNAMPRPIPVFPPVTPPPAPQLRGMQLSLMGSSAGSVAHGASVPFDTVDENNTVGVSYTPGSGQIVLSRAGTYLVNWWVAVENAQATETLAFALSLNGVDLATSYSDIGGGQIYGTAIVNVSSVSSALTLVNRSGGAVTLVTAEAQAEMTLAQLA